MSIRNQKTNIRVKTQSSHLPRSDVDETYTNTKITAAAIAVATRVSRKLHISITQKQTTTAENVETPFYETHTQTKIATTKVR